MRRAGYLAATAILLWLIGGAAATWKLTRRPRPAFAEPPPAVDGRAMRQLRLNTSDGQQIGAWHLPGTPGRGTVVFLHGIGGSRSMFFNLFEPLARDGVGILAVSHRCHGDSTGDSHDAGYSARHDVVAAVEFLREDGAANGPVVVCGSSFGAAAAAHAGHDLGTRMGVRGYLLDSLYPDLRQAAWNRLDHYLPPIVDHVAYAGIRSWSPVFLPHDEGALRPADAVRRIPRAVSVVFAVGGEDFRSTPAEVREMYESIAPHARYEEFGGAGHSLLHVDDPARYVRILKDLLREDTIEVSK